MTCHNCQIKMVKAGLYGKNRIQRFKCQKCGKRFSEPQAKPFGADVRLPQEAWEFYRKSSSITKTSASS